MRFSIYTRGVHPPRACLLTAGVAAATIGLTACGGSNPAHVASLRTIARLASANGRGSGTGGGSPTTDRSSGSSAAKLAKGNPTALVDEWATCMHSHGNPNQADPTIDAHGVINITIPHSVRGARSPGIRTPVPARAASTWPRPSARCGPPTRSRTRWGCKTRPTF